MRTERWGINGRECCESKRTHDVGKNTVLSNVNISLERGKIYGFIGQNGAGKDYLINHINGLLFPDEGEIELFGASDSKGLVNARKRYRTVSTCRTARQL